MQIADSIDNTEDDEEYDYFEEDYLDYTDNSSQIGKELKEGKKFPMDKFGWFYKVWYMIYQ